MGRGEHDDLAKVIAERQRANPAFASKLEEARKQVRERHTTERLLKTARVRNPYGSRGADAMTHHTAVAKEGRRDLLKEKASERIRIPLT